MTEIPLRDYVDRRFVDMERGVDLARGAMEKRLDSMNEFREHLKDQSSRFITRDEMIAKLDGIDKSRKDNTALFIAIFSLLIAVVDSILRYIK